MSRPGWTHPPRICIFTGLVLPEELRRGKLASGTYRGRAVTKAGIRSYLGGGIVALESEDRSSWASGRGGMAGVG